MTQKKALLLLADGYEEIEVIAPVDILRRAGIAVFIASVSGAPTATGRCGVVTHADGPLPAPDALPAAYDLLVLPGGPAVSALRKNPGVLAIIRKFAAANLSIGAICAAPLLLHDAGILAGKRHTAHDSTWGELSAALGSERVVRDGNLITSRGPGTALDFSLALAARLTDAATVAQVTRDIMA